MKNEKNITITTVLQKPNSKVRIVNVGNNLRNDEGKFCQIQIDSEEYDNLNKEDKNYMHHYLNELSEILTKLGKEFLIVKTKF